MPLTRPHPCSAILPIVTNRQIVPEVFLLALDEPRLARAALPGQFVMLSIPHVEDPLLPRPFAVFNAEGDRLEILYKRVGKGTSLLARMRAGESLRVLGPLGNGFSMPDASVTALAVTGGIGIASVHFLLAHLLRRSPVRAILLHGVRCADEIIPLEELETKGLPIRMATEDGKRGLKGTVVDLLSKTLGGAGALEKKSAEAFVCGPAAMLRAAAGTLAAFGIKGHISLESRMACGYGVCQGCVVPVRDEAAPDGIRYRKVCVDGPVFPAEGICWEGIRQTEEPKRP